MALSKIKDINAAKEYVRNQVDILKIIGDDVPDIEWRQEGSTWVACSPFRNESKPSFKVSQNKFKDWGGEQYSGDVFKWVQIWQGVRFEEAVIEVAKRSGIDIVHFLRDPTPEEIQQSIYKQANEIAANFMHSLLKENAIVRDNYLSKSGFTWEMIDPYKVGYCPSHDVLCVFVTNHIKLTDDDVHKLEFNRRDLFDDAIVYPIHNHTGEVCTFRTKQLNVSDAPYKGVHSEHPLHDSGILYGFHVARKNFRKNGNSLVIVEGQRDAIALTAAAVMTSALNEKQLNALKDYHIAKLIICYDNDETGWKKTNELIEEPKNFGNMLVLIARPSEVDTDPHELWRSGGDGAIYDMLNKAVIPIEYFTTRHYGDPKYLTLTDKNRLLVDLKDYLCKASGIDLEMTASHLSNVLGVTKDSILDHVSETKADYSRLYNLEAEKALIAACIKSSVSYNSSKAAGITKPAFTLSPYQKLFEGCQVAYDKFADNYTPQAVLDAVMVKYADLRIQDAVTAALDDQYKYTEPAACDIVLDMWKRRTVSEQSYKLAESTRDLSRPFVEVVNVHRKKLIDVVSTSRPQARTPEQLANEFYSMVQEREKSGGDSIIGYSFHSMPLLNMSLGGIQNGHMIVIGGDTGAGKSLFGMNILKCLAIDAQVPCLWVGQEMPTRDNTARLVSIMTGIHNTRIQTGSLTQAEAERIRGAKDYIAKSSKFYSAKPREGTIDEIVAIIDEYRFKYGIEVVFWDYIQLIVGAIHQNGMNREQIIGAASKVMKHRVTEDMGLAAIVIAQLNRDKESKGKQKVSGSYQIMQDCDDAILIDVKTKKQLIEDGESNGNRYIELAKRRGGMSDVRLHAHLDASEKSASLRLSECGSPKQQSEIHSKVTP